MKALSAVAFLLALAAPAVAHADWYMVGADEWKVETAFSSGNVAITSTVKGVQLTSGSSNANLVAVVRLPPSSQVTSLYCQVYDDTAGRSFAVSLKEVETYDSIGATSTGRFVATTGGTTDVGYQRVSTQTINNGFIKEWDVAVPGGSRYFSYKLIAPMAPGGFALRSCAIGYTPAP